MAKRYNWLQPIVYKALLLPVLVSLSVAVLNAQDVLDKTKDVIIDQPADKIEDVFDKDTYDDVNTPDSVDKSDMYDVDVTRHKTGATQSQCGAWSDEISKGMLRTPEMVKLDDLLENKEDFYGRTVTVEGELHRSFRDGVFTIEDDDFINDDDLLVINTTSSSTGIVALDGSLEPGKDVQVTGVIRPYDRGALECEYGPLNLESREGHSFTKGPVLVIGTPEVARVEPPPMLEKPSEPAIMPPAAPEPIPPAPPAVEPAPPALPKTNSTLPLTALIGLLSLSAACLYRGCAGRPNR